VRHDHTDGVEHQLRCRRNNRESRPRLDRHESVLLYSSVETDIVLDLEGVTRPS
jgi:hypothetical protein